MNLYSEAVQRFDKKNSETTILTKRQNFVLANHEIDELTKFRIAKGENAVEILRYVKK